MGPDFRKCWPSSFVFRFLVVWAGAGAGATVLMAWDSSRQTEAILRQTIPAVALQDTEARAALQRLANSVGGRFRLSMCPDVATRSLTLHTDHPMAFAEFVPAVAEQLGAAVDLRRSRHLQGAPSFPHVYRADAPCSASRFVYIRPAADRGGRTRAGTSSTDRQFTK
jgi:hypothetical protein